MSYHERLQRYNRCLTLALDADTSEAEKERVTEFGHGNEWIASAPGRVTHVLVVKAEVWAERIVELDQL